MRKVVRKPKKGDIMDALKDVAFGAGGGAVTTVVEPMLKKVDFINENPVLPSLGIMGISLIGRIFLPQFSSVFIGMSGAVGKEFAENPDIFSSIGGVEFRVPEPSVNGSTFRVPAF